jgi:hypothetical protein
MTKVSWKRILQRAGNDLPSHGRPMPAPAQMHSAPRSVRATESPSMIAGELETELRRALQRAQGAANSEPEQPAWDPIFVAREVRHTPPAVPVANYRHDMQANRQRGSGISPRNVVVASISAVMVGLAAYQVGMLGGGGGGGSGGGSGEQQQSQGATGPAVVAKEQQKLIETGYAIQPMVHPGNPTDLGPVNKETPSLTGEDRASAQPDNSTSEAAAIFERDMEEAVKLFEEKQGPAATKKAAEPARRKTTEPATASTRAAPAPAAEEPVAAAPAPSKRLSAVATTPAPAMPALTGPEEESLLQRASGLMKRGDVTGARLLFEHLAYRGSALGAFALAQSYDSRYLSKIYVRGLAADQKQADFWYRRAAELGGSGQSATGRR